MTDQADQTPIENKTPDRLPFKLNFTIENQEEEEATHRTPSEAVQKYLKALEPGKKPWTYELIVEVKVGPHGTPRRTVVPYPILDFHHKGHVYNNLDKDCARIIRKYKAIRGNLGAMFSGEKGSGKTLIAQLLSIACREQLNMPTFMITQKFRTPEDLRLICNWLTLEAPESLILFDELDKRISVQLQDQMLTFLSGATHSHRKLIAATINNKNRVSDFIKSRPERFLYWREFESLSNNPGFIEEYCTRNLEPQYLERGDCKSIIKLSKLYKGVNFDVLRALVDEINHEGDTPADAIKWINIDTGEWLAPSEYNVVAVDAEGNELVVLPGMIKGSPQEHITGADNVRWGTNIQPLQIMPPGVEDQMGLVRENQKRSQEGKLPITPDTFDLKKDIGDLSMDDNGIFSWVVKSKATEKTYTIKFTEREQSNLSVSAMI